MKKEQVEGAQPIPGVDFSFHDGRSHSFPQASVPDSSNPPVDSIQRSVPVNLLYVSARRRYRTYTNFSRRRR